LVTEGGVAKCLAAATGKVLWRNRLAGRYSASPICVDGKIYFLSEQGRTTIVDAAGEFNVVAQNELQEKCCASPAVSNKHIFIRSEDAVCCIGPGQ
jgi:outer membrane protein assembly factor BamB